MNDLERLWHAYPTGRPPVEDILRAGRRAGARRRRLVLRPLLAGAGVCALAVAVAGGVLVTGDPETPAGSAGSADGGGRPEALEGAAPVAFQADLQPAGSCEDLLAHYVERGRDQVTAWGWSGDLVYGAAGAAESSGAADSQAPVPQGGVPRVTGQASSDTGTNVQESGVDEPDTVKTDGSVLVRMRGSRLLTYDVTGAVVRPTGELRLPGLDDGRLLLSGTTVVAVGADEQSPSDAGTRVVTVDITDPAAPEVTDEVTYDSGLLSARQHGTSVRLVLSAALPDLDFVRPGDEYTERAALTHNREAVEDSTLADWLPGYDVVGDGEGTQDLVDCGSVAVPEEEVGLGTVSIAGFDVTSPGDPEAIALAGATTIAYESAEHLYLAATPWTGWTGWTGGDSRGSGVACQDCVPTAPLPGGTSYLFDFRLSGTSATHVASGEVEGIVADRWSMDEARGVLRVAVGPSAETGDFNSVVTLRREGTDLVEAGRVDRLGVGEQIKSVRWFDDLAIVVTFREVDPLYAIDLSDTGRPRLLGELKIPGYSSYLHPLGHRRLLGLGEGPDRQGRWGAQVGLFDVSDLTAVRQRDVHHLRAGSGFVAGRDPRSVTWLPGRRTALAVLQQGSEGHLAVIRPRRGELEVRTQRVEYGEDVAEVRTLGLPDGRVVLVTGEDVSFLTL